MDSRYLKEIYKLILIYKAHSISCYYFVQKKRKYALEVKKIIDDMEKNAKNRNRKILHFSTKKDNECRREFK